MAISYIKTIHKDITFKEKGTPITQIMTVECTDINKNLNKSAIILLSCQQVSDIYLKREKKAEKAY